MGKAEKRIKPLTLECIASNSRALPNVIFGGLNEDIRKRVAGAVEGLKIIPRPPGCKKLHGEKSLWRVRVGNFRIVYRVQDDVLLVLVIKIADRKDAYR